MRINYDFLDLQAFLAVKDTGSFHLASQRLNLSQSSITRRVRKLEQALGTTLFERTTRDVRPTLAAKRLQIRAEAILQDARETALAMRDESMAFTHQRTQTVTLATIPTVITGLIAPAILAFRAAGHTARIRILDLSANDVAEAVAQGEADIGLASIPMLEPATDFELLFEDSMVLALPPDHPLTTRNRVVWQDLPNMPLILPARGTGNRLLIDEALARTGTQPKWTYEVGRTTSAITLVAAGLGVAVLPETALVGTDPTTLTKRAITDPKITRPIGLLTRTGHTPSGAIQHYVQALRDTLPLKM